MQPADEARLRATERRITALENIKGGKGIVVQRTPGGVSITAKPTHAVSGRAGVTADAPDTGGIVNEIYPEFDVTRIYRSGERVVYKPTGWTYYYVYQCLTADTVGSNPDTDTTNWDKVTNSEGVFVVLARTTTEWSAETTYDADDLVLYFSKPFQAKRYKSLVGSNEALPTDAASWEYEADIPIGLVSWPAASATPFAVYDVCDIRFYISSATGYYTFGHRRKVYNKIGELTSVGACDYVIWADATVCEAPA